MKKRLLLFLAAAAFLYCGEAVDVLFYLQDAGETYALVPVARQLKEQGLKVKVLTAGAAEDLVPADLDRFLFPTLRVDRSWTRIQLAPNGALNDLLEAVEPRLVVTGVAYELQGQVLDACRERGVPALAYWDHFNPDGENPYFKTARSVAAHAVQVLVPTNGFESVFPMARVVGQPTLEEWASEIAAMEPIELRQKLGICTCEQVILFIGGYGEEYIQSFRLFAECMSRAEIEDLLVLVQPHPKCAGGAAELAILENYPFPFQILTGEVTTKEAVAVSSAVACHQSTAAFQALAAKKPVIHFIPEGQIFTSLPLEKGLAQKVARIEDFPNAWNQANQAPDNDIFAILGAPRNSTELCAETLLEYLPPHLFDRIQK